MFSPNQPEALSSTPKDVSRDITVETAIKSGYEDSGDSPEIRCPIQFLIDAFHMYVHLTLSPHDVSKSYMDLWRPQADNKYVFATQSSENAWQVETYSEITGGSRYCVDATSLEQVVASALPEEFRRLTNPIADIISEEVKQGPKNEDPSAFVRIDNARVQLAVAERSIKRKTDKQ
jgi:hypothetical protein